jgi:peptidoglycan/xylan/chitin deacetylase (PgdA/CDA1 family)
LAALGFAGYKLYERLQDPGSTFFGPAFTGLRSGSGVVALTFDDGPNGEDTSAVLDVLREEAARATFFVVGKAALREPELLRRIVDEGHALGNHGWSHTRWNFLQSDALRDELERTDDVIFSATGTRTHIARPPFGARSSRVLEELRRMNYTCVLWSVPLAAEWKCRSIDTIAHALSDRASDGSIVVLHDGDRGRHANRRHIAAAVRCIIRNLRDRRLHFATIQEMLALAPAA